MVKPQALRKTGVTQSAGRSKIWCSAHCPKMGGLRKICCLGFVSECSVPKHHVCGKTPHLPTRPDSGVCRTAFSGGGRRPSPQSHVKKCAKLCAGQLDVRRTFSFKNGNKVVKYIPEELQPVTISKTRRADFPSAAKGLPLGHPLVPVCWSRGST